MVDSASDYTPEEIRQKEMELVPIRITMADASYTDGVNLERNDFYRILTETKDFPKTSQPSPQDFLEAFRRAKQRGDTLICILLSSALSGTYQSAMLAKTMVEYDKIYLIDSLSATCSIKIMADYAWQLAADGHAAEEIVHTIEQLKPRVKVIAALDTLEYLQRGGRIGRTAAAIGEMTNLKPLITLTANGEVSVLEKCFGKNKAISHILSHLQEHGADRRFPLYTLYTYGTANCEKLEQKLSASGHTPDDRLQVGATIGAHIGPEAFGILFVEK